MAIIQYNEAIRLALHDSMAADSDVVVMGLGVPDPGGVFGTTLELQETFGPDRAMDIPCAENGMTGIALGMALGGKKVVLSHQRVDFSFLSLEQLFNQASKWHFMFGGQESVSMVVRMVIGRGWGQGPQHSQFTPSIFSHFPGLKVVCPVFPSDARELMQWAINDPNPVIFLEHRWLHFVKGEVTETASEKISETPKRLKQGDSVTLVSYSYGVLECLESAKFLDPLGVTAEVFDLRFIAPLQIEPILNSVRKTGKLIVLEHTWESSSVGAEVISKVAIETSGCSIEFARIALPSYPLPTAPTLAKTYYPGWRDVVRKVANMLSLDPVPIPETPEDYEHDKPNPNFKGPF